MAADFSGYATRANLKCSDGRTIMAGAFKHMFEGKSKVKVPLVWQHQHNDGDNVLGHALLELRNDGVYAYGYFNETPKAKTAKEQVRHGDIDALSIYANQLIQKGANVLHGAIREVSLVITGANPGAFIDNINIAHGDIVESLDDEAIIYTGLELEHSGEDEEDVSESEDDDAEVDESEDEDDADDEDSSEEESDESNTEGDEVAPKPELQHAASAASKTDDGPTVQEVYDGLTDEQKTVVHFLIGEAVAEAEESSDSAAHSGLEDQEGYITMPRNVFEQLSEAGKGDSALIHSQLAQMNSAFDDIIKDAQKNGSLKESVIQHAAEYGIENIDYLFPDAKAVSDTPDFISRRMDWVASVISGARHTPFSRIKSIAADITADEARALGYVKGNLKKEEIISLLKRTTAPTTVYKKQKLDRDDVLDITSFDVVAWLKGEMRIMLDEEIARAILVGDGRDPSSEDHILDGVSGVGIRPIAKDDPMYTDRVNLAANVSGQGLIDAVIRNRKNYKGSGNPTAYISEDVLSDLLLLVDKVGRRLYPTMQELATAMRVSEIISVPIFDGVTDEDGYRLGLLLVNISDYTIGADRGGEVSMFDQFDIDYNQQKYLIETRISGALTKPKTAQAFWLASGTLVASVTAPTFNSATNTITIPSVTGVVYSIDGEVASSGSNVIEDDAVVTAAPADGYYFAPGTTTTWNFTYNDAA